MDGTIAISEANIQLRITALVTSNFGGALNNDGAWNDIVDAVENRFNEYLDQETITRKRSYTDRRIHACLYMIPPTGHWYDPMTKAKTRLTKATHHDSLK